VRHVTPERNKNAFGHASRAASCAEVASLRAETIASQTNRSGKATARNPAISETAHTSSTLIGRRMSAVCQRRT
jgi:hypothetical protein